MASQMLLDTAAAARELRNGQIIAYPTEAVFGLGCDPGNEHAVRRLMALKGRPESAGFVLIASDFSQLQPWIAETPVELIEKAMRSWPGPVTWLFPRASDVPDYIAGQHETVALRITAHEPSRDLCEAFGGALISSSANPAAARPARSARLVKEYFASGLGGILSGSLGGADHSSQIRDLRSGDVLRQGQDS